jgi:hypothetical protein
VAVVEVDAKGLGAGVFQFVKRAQDFAGMDVGGLVRQGP